MFQKINSATGLTAGKARAAISKGKLKESEKITPFRALAFLLNQNLTSKQYNAVREISRVHGAAIWPSYKEIQNAKQQCRPADIEATDHSAFVPLQQLLDHTTRKILASDPSIKSKMQDLAEENGLILDATLTFKYGFDGSGSHNRPMQPDREGDHSTVKSLFLTQMAPLEISALVGDEVIVLWKCSRPNNPHACRPVRLSYEAENKETINLENDRLSTEISNLECYLVSDNPKIQISYKGLMTLVDGKVVSAITNKNLTKCTICDASRSEMAIGLGPFNPVSDQRLSFGLSPLHFSLRAFETLLHIGYKQDVKTFQVKKIDAVRTHQVEIRTQQVKDSFLTELGLKWIGQHLVEPPTQAIW